MKKDRTNDLNIWNLVFIIVFAFMISLPLLFHNRQEGKVSKTENRVLAAKPSLFQEDGTIPEFEAYVDDNIGFKEQALAANIILKYRLFHVLDIPDWILGKDNNLFYTSGGEDIRTYAGQNAYSKADLKSMAANLENMNQYFERLGCYTYNMFIPNKEAVYSEYYPSGVTHSPKSRQDIFCRYFAKKYKRNVINVRDDLLAEKDKGAMLFYKNFDASHWNMNGAFVGYRRLMEEIKKDIPEITILEREDFDITEDKFTGLMYYYAQLGAVQNSFDFEDTIYTWTLKGGYHSVMDEEPPEGIVIDPNLSYYHYYNQQITNGETLFIVGDSYLYNFLLPMFGESFEHVYFIRNYNKEMTIEWLEAIETISELAEVVCPDVFVFEVVERVFNKSYFDYMSAY